MKLQLKFELILTYNNATIDKEISIFSNSCYLEWRVGMSDKILKGDHPSTMPAKLGLVVSEVKI